MLKKDQIVFVKELIDRVQLEIIQKIQDDIVPDTWDGIELRQYIADKFADCAFIKMDKRRKREYSNVISTTTL